MITSGSFMVAATLSVCLWWIMNFWNDSLPTQDQSQRYHERRRRSREDDFVVVRSFRYRRNAMKWMRQCDRFSGTLELVDSKTQRVLFERNID